MNKMKYLSLLAGVLVVLASCSPFKVVSDYDRNADFSHYKTYTLRLDELNINDIDESRVTGELQRQLALKNILPADSADLVISIKASHKIVRNNYITPSIHLGSWGRWLGGGVSLGRTISNEYNQGTLIFDFIDTKTGKLIWQSTGSGIKVDSPESKQKQIPEIITEMLKNFPPKKE